MAPMKPRQGAMMAMLPMVIMALVFVAAIMVDVGTLYVGRSQMQHAADAAAVAAAMSIGNDRSEEALERALTYGSAFANYNQEGRGDVLLAEDIELGIWDFETDEFKSTNYVDLANAYRVTVRRDGVNSDSLASYFGSMFGIYDVEATAVATAIVSSSSTGIGIPVALRDPAFGEIEAGLTAANPNLDGPSIPENSRQFQIGESVVLMMYGDDCPVAHLTLAYDELGWGASSMSVEKILSGEKPDVEMQVGDEVRVLDYGMGDGAFAVELEKRYALDADDPKRTVVLPIVEILDDSRHIHGQIYQEVRISDFVSVFLDDIVERDIVDPEDPDETVTVKLMMGTVGYRRANATYGGASPSGVGGKTVSITQLVN